MSLNEDLSDTGESGGRLGYTGTGGGGGGAKETPSR